MPASFQDLPAEIVQLVISHALPLPSYSSFPERYRTLLSCALVSRAWTPLAQALLFSQLHFPSPVAVDRYLTATCAYDEPSKSWMPTPRGLALANLAKSVFFGGGRQGPIAGSGESARMMVVLVLLVNVRVVWVDNLMPFAIEQLASLRVERLHLSSVKIITPYDGLPRLLLPHLRKLFLSRTAVGLIDLATGGMHAHSPSAYLDAAFPALETVSIDRSFQFESSGEVSPIALPAPGTEAACRTLRVDTTILSEGGEPAIDWIARLPAFTALDRLALSDPTNLLDLAAVIAPSAPLETLEVLLPRSAAGEAAPVDSIAWDLKIMSALLSDAPGLKRVKRLIVSKVVNSEGGLVGDQRTRIGLREMCARLGVAMEERPFGPEGDVDRWHWVGLE